jgi:hypothetical protein
MHFNTIILIAVGAIVITLFSCGSSLYLPTQAEANKVGTTIDTLTLARKVYINNCGSCHRLYNPQDISTKDWEKVLPKMIKKAKLKKDYEALVSMYIHAGIKN